MRTILIMAVLLLVAVACRKSESATVDAPIVLNVEQRATQICADEADLNITAAEMSYSGGVRYYKINMEQFTAMAQILFENPSVRGFRIYRCPGISVVEGIDSAGMMIPIPKFSTSHTMSGPCPEMCD